MAFTKRQMLLVPEVNPASFVFFFERGSSGASWSIRDYSTRNRVRTYRPGDIQQSADYFFQKAKYAFNAPAHDTNDLEFWHKHTLELNQKYGANTSVPHSVPALSTGAAQSGSGYPILGLEQLMSLPKARKSQDMERILHSASSEDWVTWNFFQILQGQCSGNWWKQMIQAAVCKNPEVDLPTTNEEVPALAFWSLVHSPDEYLEESRRRMLSSRNPMWVARATSLEPVEGASEIDVTIESDALLIYVEAKLGSDISMSTTYDPHRNQIIRNIDCLLDNAGHRAAAFWMLVRDEEPSRCYVQLMNAYKADPELLSGDLPHRTPSELETVARNLTILKWSDFSSLLCGPDADLQVASVRRELNSRISGALDRMQHECAG